MMPHVCAQTFHDSPSDQLTNLIKGSSFAFSFHILHANKSPKSQIPLAIGVNFQLSTAGLPRDHFAAVFLLVPSN